MMENFSPYHVSAQVTFNFKNKNQSNVRKFSNPMNLVCPPKT